MSVQIDPGEDHVDAQDGGAEVVHQFLLGKAAAHDAGGDGGDAFGGHDGHHPVQQGLAHALVAGAGLDIDGDQLAIASLAGHDDLADEHGVAIQPQGHEMGHAHQGLEVIQLHEGDFVDAEPIEQAILLIPGVQRGGRHGAAHGDSAVPEGNGQLQDIVGFAAVKAVLLIEILHLDIRRGDAGIQAGPKRRVQPLQHPGAGHQRAEQQITGRGIPVNGEIQVDRTVRIQAGLILIQDKTVSGLRAEIIDRVEDVFRIQPVNRLAGVNNIHWFSFSWRQSMSVTEQPASAADAEETASGTQIIPGFGRDVKTLAMGGNC